MRISELCKGWAVWERKTVQKRNMYLALCSAECAHLSFLQGEPFNANNLVLMGVVLHFLQHYNRGIWV